MSAAEIIELIKKLPPEEKAEVIAHFQKERVEKETVLHATDSDFERAAKRVFAENHDLLRRLAQ